jgi:hypothetical protein
MMSPEKAMTVILCCCELILGYGLCERNVDEPRLSPDLTHMMRVKISK